MRCSRCKGKVISDKMFDLPGKILEYYCINCGERFWQEKPGQAGLGATPLANQDGHTQDLRLGSIPLRLMTLNN